MNWVYPVVLTVQFDPATYSSNEGEQVEFIIVLSSPAVRNVTVDFTTVDGSATGMCLELHLKLAFTKSSSW